MQKKKFEYPGQNLYIAIACSSTVLPIDRWKYQPGFSLLLNLKPFTGGKRSLRKNMHFPIRRQTAFFVFSCF